MKSIRPITSTLLQPATRAPAFSCRAALLAERSSYPSNHSRRQQQRTFVSNPFAGPTSLTATRTLRYPSKVIYEVISDVGSYSQFLPYCQGSEVTKTSSPHSNGKTYPEEAKLLIGYNNDVSEEFCSRVYCVPETIVEAVSGSTVTKMKPDQIEHHSERPEADHDPARKATVLSQLSTTWTLRPFPYKPPPASAMHPETASKNTKETSEEDAHWKTEVNLTILYEFANPVYGAMSSAAAPVVADKMIDAFEKRVKAVVEGPANVGNDAKKMREGVLQKS